jgi:hypothetical protein
MEKEEKQNQAKATIERFADSCKEQGLPINLIIMAEWINEDNQMLTNIFVPTKLEQKETLFLLEFESQRLRYSLFRGCPYKSEVKHNVE